MATLRDEGRLTHSCLSCSGARVFISTSLPLTPPLLSLRRPPALVLSPLPPIDPPPETLPFRLLSLTPFIFLSSLL